MDYLIFNKTDKELYIRDSLTTTHNRVTFKVLAFYMLEDSFRFELDPKNVMGFKEIYFPRQKTVLSII